MNELLNVIEQNFKDPDFNVNKLLDMTNCSYSYIYEKFELNIGLSPHKYIENKRLEFVISLISGNNMKLIDICKASGYSNSRTFREAIKRKYNMTPAELRETFL